MQMEDKEKREMKMFISKGEEIHQGDSWERKYRKDTSWNSFYREREW